MPTLPVRLLHAHEFLSVSPSLQATKQILNTECMIYYLLYVLHTRNLHDQDITVHNKTKALLLSVFSLTEGKVNRRQHNSKLHCLLSFRSKHVIVIQQLQDGFCLWKSRVPNIPTYWPSFRCSQPHLIPDWSTLIFASGKVLTHKTYIWFMPVWYISIVSTEIFHTKIQPARYHPPNKWNPSEVAPGGHFGSTTFTPQSFPPFSPWNLNPSEMRKWSIMVFGDSELGFKKNTFWMMWYYFVVSWYQEVEDIKKSEDYRNVFVPWIAPGGFHQWSARFRSWSRIQGGSEFSELSSIWTWIPVTLWSLSSFCLPTPYKQHH